MTNREWLESLTNKQLAEWLCDRYAVYYDTNIGVPSYYYTGINTERAKYTISFEGIQRWLSEEHKDD